MSDTPAAAATHPLRVPRYRRYWFAQMMVDFGQFATVMVLGWQTYDTARITMSTERASLMLGILGLVQFVPLAACAPVAGWVVDRQDRRLVALWALLTQLACVATLGAATISGFVSLPLLFGVGFAFGAARSFGMPAKQSITPNLVPADVLPSAIALTSMSMQIGVIAGPTMGGLLYGVSPELPHVVIATMQVVGAVLLFSVGPVTGHRSLRGPGTPWQQMSEGFRYVRRNRIVLGATSLDLFAVMMGGATAMLPVFARDVLHVGSEGLGVLRAAPAVGAVVMGVALARRPVSRRVGAWMFVSVAVFGVATMGFGLSRELWLSLACLFVMGAADMVSMYVRGSLIQLSTPDEMRGRVGAVAALFISGSNELGEAESGLLGALIGPVAAVVLGGAAAVAIAAGWARLFPELRRADRFTDTPLVRPDAPGGAAG
ncbi:MAG: MFS transporter [Thermoleophilia bacterium]|nr:MFS transporter [Thermoleophilia bacterium]